LLASFAVFAEDRSDKKINGQTNRQE